MRTKKIILDVDTGLDDALAILLAIKSEKFKIGGITTVAGNTNLRQVIKNTLKVLNLTERLDIPVFKGNPKPLKGKGKKGKTSGKDGLCEVSLYCPDKKAEKLSAEKFILETSEKYPKTIIIVATGPLTNIAKVLKSNPAIKKKIRKLIIMGGAVEVPGNITPWAEFNFFNDPEAVKFVFESGVLLTLIPLDVTMKILLTRDWILKRYKKSRDPITKFIISLVNNRYKLVGKDWMHLHDPLAVGVAINKNFVITRKEKLDIITRGKQRGQVIKSSQGLEIEWASKVKEKEFLSYFENLLLK